MWEGKRVSVVFPVYNEQANVAQAVEDFLATTIVDEGVVVNNKFGDDAVREV